MSLKYALLENLLTPRKDDYTAQSQEVKSHDINSITQKMIEKGSTITMTDTLAVLHSFFEVIKEITKEGETIHTDLINTNFSIQGVFEGAADAFDLRRHTVRLNVNAGKELKQVIPDIPLEKTTAPEILPYILEVKDSITGSVNENITSKGVIEITGSMLKIQGDNPANGAAFIAQDGTKHKAVTLVDNKPARLIIIAPALKAGEYTLQLTTQYSGSNTLKEPRKGVFNKPLTVV